jgi:hypothetical protein
VLTSAAPPSAEVAQPAGAWFATFVVCWALVALAALLLLARAAVGQRRRLASRVGVRDAACLEVLERLARQAGFRRSVRLSSCAAVSTPFVLNTREICLPERALELDRVALEAVLAHELRTHRAARRPVLNGALLPQALLWFHGARFGASAQARAELERLQRERTCAIGQRPLLEFDLNTCPNDSSATCEGQRPRAVSSPLAPTSLPTIAST